MDGGTKKYGTGKVDGVSEAAMEALNIEAGATPRGRAGDDKRDSQTEIDIANGGIYPDIKGTTVFDRYYGGLNKPVPPYVGVKSVPAITWIELFAQQMLPAWRPVITPQQVVLTLVSMGVLMVAIGIACTVATLNVVEVRAEYSNLSPADSQTDLTVAQKHLLLQTGTGYDVEVTLDIPKNMEPPIYVYYELTKFYQNNRRYVRSVSAQQMAGLNSGLDTLRSFCEPMLFVGGEPNATGEALPNDGLITPCGLQSWSYFNDTFEFSKVSPDGVEAGTLPVNERGIAWPSDKRYLYGNVTAENFNTLPPYRGGDTVTDPLSEDEHFMVWMKLAARPSFWKLWGKIEEPLSAGEQVRVAVSNRFNVYGYGGTKSIVLTTNSFLGHKNLFLGVLYLAVGGLFLALGTLFQTLYWFKPRSFGDERHLSWNR